MTGDEGSGSESEDKNEIECDRSWECDFWRWVVRYVRYVTEQEMNSLCSFRAVVGTWETKYAALQIVYTVFVRWQDLKDSSSADMQPKITKKV